MTMMSSQIDPEVLSDMISDYVEDALTILPYVTVDNTLQGIPGTTITVPRFVWGNGEVEVVPEGQDIPIRELNTDQASYTVKKVGEGYELTDEVVLSAYGNPMGQIARRLARRIIEATQKSALESFYEASTIFAATGVISYENIVLAIDLFQEEINLPKAMFVAPSQVTQLRLDPNFISADKYDNNVIMRGEIGMIANTRIVSSKLVKRDESGESPVFLNPIVQLQIQDETDVDEAAVTVYLKRDTQVETERHSRRRTTEITADKHYTSALTNDDRVVILQVAALPSI